MRENSQSPVDSHKRLGMRKAFPCNVVLMNKTCHTGGHYRTIILDSYLLVESLQLIWRADIPWMGTNDMPDMSLGQIQNNSLEKNNCFTIDKKIFSPGGNFNSVSFQQVFWQPQTTRGWTSLLPRQQKRFSPSYNFFHFAMRCVSET